MEVEDTLKAINLSCGNFEHHYPFFRKGLAYVISLILLIIVWLAIDKNSSTKIIVSIIVVLYGFCGFGLLIQKYMAIIEADMVNMNVEIQKQNLAKYHSHGINWKLHPEAHWITIQLYYNMEKPPM